MADSFKIKFDAPKLNQVLRDYQRVSGMDHAKVLEKKGKQLSIEMYKEGRKYVPTKQRIRDEAKAVFDRGGRLRTKFKTASGVGVTFSNHDGPRGPKSARFNVPAEIMKMEINWRQAHRFVTASSWLFQRWRVGARSRKLVRNNFKSTVVIATEKDGPMYIRIENSQPGAIVQNAKRGIIEKAMSVVTLDMLQYLNRKLEQRANEFSRKNPNFKA